MKRNALSLLLHPYKNGLIPRPLLKESLGRFFTTLLNLHQSFPQLRTNLIIPGYLLENSDPLHLAQMRDLCKRNCIEIISTGYTEPFLSFSPPELTIKNIHHGLKVVEELTGQMPCGFHPPFSNWEPSFIEALRSMGLRYTLLSNSLFEADTRTIGGYWVTEHTGSSIGLIGTHIISPSIVQSSFIEWLENLYTPSTPSIYEPFITLHYLIPLASDKTDDAYSTLQTSIKEIEKHLLTYQPVCISDILNAIDPIGLQYIPTSLQLGRKGEVDLHFLNFLFSFDQIGFMQRKLLDIYNRTKTLSDQRLIDSLLPDFYFVQDINRFLPGKDSGFEVPADREATYTRLLGIDRQLHSAQKNGNGKVRVTDFLRNGGKIIILSNKNIKASIDHHHGGQIIGYDFRLRQINLCSSYNATPHKQPDIFTPGSSRTWFLDRILHYEGNELESSAGLVLDTADFQNSDFDYKVRKNTKGINVSLVRTGSFSSGNRQFPLSIEKVFGLEKDSSLLSFVYQFNNPSLMTCRFTFSTELHIYLPGIIQGTARLTTGKNSYERIGREFLRFPLINSWSIEDRHSGTRFQMKTQKPITLWCLPPYISETIEGIRVILTAPVNLNPSSQSKLLGKIICKSIKKTSEEYDAV